MACIYKIVNLINGKFYIGSTQTSFNKRKGEHLSELRKGYHKNRYLMSSWIKYGENNFKFEVVEEFCFPKNYNKDYIYEYVTLRELYYINLLNPQYNLTKETSTGKLGRVVSEKEKERIGSLNRGKKLSEETKIKIREARAKQVITEEHRRKIGLKSKGNKYCLGIKKSEKQKQELRERTLNLISRGIGLHSEASKIKRTNTLKIRFNSPEMRDILIRSARSRSKRPFLCFKDGEFIGEFLSQADTADLLNLKSSEICAVLRKEQKTTRGYTFKYKEDGELG